VNGSLPVMVVTGFLGSGKTTMISGLLRHPGLEDTAVLVNEFGEIGLDHLLVEHVDESTILIGQGCLCCAVREDLVVALMDLLERREAGAVPGFRRLVVETTGLADPAPILHTLLADDRLRGRCHIAGIITTVDVLHARDQLEREPECLRQAAVADRLVLTKTDLADGIATSEVSRRLEAINPDAPQDRAPVAPDILTTAAEHGEDRASTARWLDQPDHHHHDTAISAMTLRAEKPLRIDRVVAWIEDTIARYGDRLLRLKGILDVEGSAVPVAVHGVQHVFHPLQRLSAWPEGPRVSRLVLIGRDLPVTDIEDAFVRRTGSPVV
tara:strand:- start:31538 stop:32512 length:975 start_codon:yes stop_codon:yes gene_type:complete